MTGSFSSLVSALRKEFVDYSNQKLQEIGLSQGLLYFILYIGKHPGCSPKELGQALRMDVGYTARSLSRLEQTGFIRQEQNPRDKRAHILYLTDSGESAFQYSKGLFSDWEEQVLSVLTSEEQETLMTLLARLAGSEGRERHV